MANRRVGRGFTLIEMLIVIAMLGAIAAVVYPRFADATDEAGDTALRTQLREIRQQIGLYRTLYGGALPPLAAGWTPLTQAGIHEGKKVGPFLPAAPVNPLNSRANVVNGTGNAEPINKAGFVYDYAGGNGSGKILATKSNGKTLLPY